MNERLYIIVVLKQTGVGEAGADTCIQLACKHASGHFILYNIVMYLLLNSLKDRSTIREISLWMLFPHNFLIFIEKIG